MSDSQTENSENKSYLDKTGEQTAAESGEKSIPQVLGDIIGELSFLQIAKSKRPDLYNLKTETQMRQQFADFSREKRDEIQKLDRDKFQHLQDKANILGLTIFDEEKVTEVETTTFSPGVPPRTDA